MSVEVVKFGNTNKGEEVKLYKIKNSNGVVAEVIDFGAILVNLLVPDKAGKVKDVVLGYDDVERYEDNDLFFGATIGPNANRIGGYKFTLDGIEYVLADNDKGNNLHSDFDNGFHKKIWDAEVSESAVKFSLKTKDLEIGFPGNMEVSVKYELTDDNELKLIYDGVSDKKTIFNLTNHTYFALGGHDAGKDAVYNTLLTLNASKFTEIVKGAIPTGKLIEVKGTALDFTAAKKIGEEIESDYEQMVMVGGYDHNYAIDNYDGTVKKIAEASYDGITMEVYSDLPGIQLYSGNFIYEHAGKKGCTYDYRNAFCLETQYFPNAVNEASFVSPVKDAFKKYHTETIYKFI